ncbi:S9 family peptidase [Pelomonas aquatica]|jgi:dipeptidyl aminopeptidase/acylaminoacyl peptidase|uniref:S9 family peptidase n=1 Tax=Pelomonas aquatica TaxID=431058 RepID=A0A9X4LGU2_9BURK|nr:prolyl oligopeptidase family serine peptidase [Pelomonas aquatica]MCY4755978.1 prolyl oligopeptidase family serine peptidase [Pelomonas aquatica]MDG0862923.1 S9 family peptidase [Pelomonas aquatica]
MIRLSLCALGITLLAACAAAPKAPEATVAPNANLFVQGIPPVPQSLADAVGRYNDFRGHGFADWHPTRREMLVSHRKAGANTAQLFRVTAPLADGEQLTDGIDPVTQASYEPRSGRYAVFERAIGGNEVAQLYRLPLDQAGAQPVLLTSPDERHAMNAWLRRSGQLIYSAVPIDRTAQGGTRSRITTTLWLMDPEKPEGRRKLAELDGGGWSASQASPDERLVALTRYLSANESQVWMLDLDSGVPRQVAPAAGSQEARAAYAPVGWAPDGRTLWIATDRAGEFRELARLDLDSGRIERVSGHIPWDVSGVSLTDDGRKLAARFNVDGREELHFFDAATARELPAPALPAGNVGAAHYDHARAELAFSVSNAQGPGQVYSLAADGRLQQWTRAYAPPGIDTSGFSEQKIVRWKSFDGTTISGLLTPPPAKFSGRRPVLIAIHGGPESQAQMGFLGRNAYYVQELGMALIQPNVRGSAGYGKSFLAMDNGFKREDSVKDIGALLDWIATQPDLDASRVLVTGGSYGGYMTLAVSTHYADRIAGAIDVVGISHFVTFLNNTESYRRDLRRVEYGDERDPAMRAHLDKISPLTNVARIKKPLFVVQGRNDPRVPYTEAEQIVAKVREGGTPVWYLRAENEGHGFQKKENQDFQIYATVLFMQQTVLK